MNTQTNPQEPETHHIENHGTIQLVQAYANDLTVVNAARVSYGKHTNTLTEPDIKLIHYLMKNGHGTPFEHNMLTYKITCPIFIAREWFRHRTASYNEISGRYTQLPQTKWTPQPHQLRTQTGKPGHYQYQPANPTQAQQAHQIIQNINQQTQQAYQQLLNLGIAKEHARIILPLTQTTQFIYTTNARSLLNLISLRNHPTAQHEIQQYAKTLEHTLHQHMPHTTQAFIQNGRKAP